MTDTIVIRLTGDSGDGVQLVGEQLTVTAALSGRDVRTLPDFPAEIRAPAGSVAGVSGFQLAMSEHAIFTAGETLDVLVALNPAGLKNALPFLKEGGLLIINEDNFTDKDWSKAGLTANFLEDQREFYQVISIPLVANTLSATQGFDISNTQAKKSKNFYILGVVLWLFELPIEGPLAFIQKKFKEKTIALANTETLKAGYNYAMTLELSRSDFIIGTLAREKGHWRQITGVEAIGLALATLAVGTNTPLLVAGYPITPASAILHEAAKLTDYGVQLLQAEDEIAAICACLGASFGGKLALTCTSGPGFDLKAESLGLGFMAELPMVLIDVQRAGASTGLPTKTGQSDLALALYGRHGESTLPVLAAKSPADCFDTVIEAFSLATRFMTPVIVLIDAYLANAAEPWAIPAPDEIVLPTLNFNRDPKPFSRNDELARSWNTPGTPGYIYQVGGLEKQGASGKVSYDAENHQNMVALRAQKVQNISKTYAPLVIEGRSDAEILIMGWGSTYGAIQGAVVALKEKGIAVAHCHLKHLFPLPAELKSTLTNYKKILVPELNSGHLTALLRSTYLVDAQCISQINGQPFSINALTRAIEEELHHE